MGFSRVGIAIAALAALLLAGPAAAERILPFHHAFDLVWRTVNETYFDPDFDGRDWNAIGVKHRARIAVDTDRDQFVAIANDILFELGRSHMMVVPSEGLWRYVPTVFAEATPGLTVRVADGKVLVSAVDMPSSAAAAGIAVGDVVTGIDGTAAGDIIAAAEAAAYPPFNHRHRAGSTVRALHAALYGRGGSDVTVTLRKADDTRQTHTLRRRARERQPSAETPAAGYAFDFESRVLDGGIVYVRFNYFAPPLVQRFYATLYEHGGPAGTIIDLRGNAGGFFDTLNLVATRLTVEKTPFYALHARDYIAERPLPGVGDAYTGPLAVLVDETTLSAAELFAGALQAAGRAVVVGNRTPGYLMGARWTPLPRGLSLIYAFAEPRLPDGTVLEGRGVVPDIDIARDARSLAAGRDVQLDAAVAHLQSITRTE